jgi:hypothetical protein
VYFQEANMVPFELLARGQMTASQVFASIQVRVEWHQGVAPRGQDGEIAIVQFDGPAPDAFHAGALAYAAPYGTTGTRIHVLFDRVLNMGGTPRLAGVLLGHVMAHEITHVLQAISRHSDTGVMKAHWDDHDFWQMAVRPLPFDPADVWLVRQGLGRRTEQRAGNGREVSGRRTSAGSPSVR